MQGHDIAHPHPCPARDDLGFLVPALSLPGPSAQIFFSLLLFFTMKKNVIIVLCNILIIKV